MAIQHRRGVYNKFDPSSLVAGEWAIVLSGDESASDGMAAYICFAAGTVKRVATFEDMAENIVNANADLIAELTEAIAQATEAANAATSSAETATANADTATESANSAAATATSAANSANSAASTATSAATTATTAAGRANSAADEAEALLENYSVEYSDLSDECKETIAQSAAAGASVITDEEGVAIIDDMAALIATGRSAGCLTDEEGLSIINAIFE